nr:S49 family peptidase [uncultured Flavobacterium sp.]
MRVNHQLMDILRGEWLMTFEGIKAYAPIVYNLIMGEEKLQAVNQAPTPQLILNVVDKNNRFVERDEKGRLTDIPPGSIAQVDMIGPLMKYGGWCHYGADDIVAALLQAQRHPNIIGTKLNNDGPGGSVGGVGVFQSFRAQKTKPVIVSADQACSLNYWGGLELGDRFYANNNVSAQFGSVGVVSTFYDNKEYLEKLGYKFHEIYPDESKHKNEAFRLALEGNYDLIKAEMLSPLAQKFQNAVRAARPDLVEEVGVLTGKTFDAETALRYGMIDGIKTDAEIFDEIRLMAEMQSFRNRI